MRKSNFLFSALATFRGKILFFGFLSDFGSRVSDFMAGLDRLVSSELGSALMAVLRARAQSDECLADFGRRQLHHSLFGGPLVEMQNDSFRGITPGGSQAQGRL